MKRPSTIFCSFLFAIFLISFSLEGNKKKKTRKKNKITVVTRENDSVSQQSKKLVHNKSRGCGLCAVWWKLYEATALVPPLIYYQLMLVLSEKNAQTLDESEIDSDVEQTHEKARKIVKYSWQRIADY